MEESVILKLPLALLLYGAALFFCLFDRTYRASGWWFSLLSAVFAIAASAYSLIMGASPWETATVLMVFLLLNMGVEK